MDVTDVTRVARRTARRLRDRAAAEAVRQGAAALKSVAITLEYPPNQHNEPRYITAHPLLDERIAAGRHRYAQTLSAIKGFAEDLAKIPVTTTDPAEPAWSNWFLPGLDGAAIYSFIRSRAPQRYMEVGSGNSTKFVARARSDGGLATTITSVDPNPRAEIDALCDEVIRTPLESQDLELWTRVQPGDMIFMDGSHRVFMNGDVVAFFLDVLPNLPAGVLVGIHDIYLPYDYPAHWADRYYSEQYVLAAWLLGGAAAEIILPAHWVSIRMRDELNDLWSARPEFAGFEHHGGAFWLETSEPRRQTESAAPGT